MSGQPSNVRRKAMLTRRGALLLGASALSVWCTSACKAIRGIMESGGGAGMSKTIIKTYDEALACALDVLASRHGEAFHFVSSYGDPYDAGRNRLGYDFCLAPDGEPEHYFTAMMGVEKDTNELAGSVNSNYSQWLFKERVEGPFREALAADPGVVGYAAVLFYARLDSRVWSEGELGEYMGRGEAGDPRVDAVAMVPRDVTLDDAVQTTKRVQDALWSLGTSMRLSVAREGDDPYKDWIYSTDSGKQLAATRGEAPSLADVERDLSSFSWPAETHPWDGTGDVGDPAYGGTKPQIIWK